jgi:hypothetical protein
VTTPSAATIQIAQGVIAGSQPPSGYTFLNQQVNITILNQDGTELQASGSAPIRLAFTIDGSLMLAGQDYTTLQIFRNGVLIPNCLGSATIPAANFDPCVTARESIGGDARLTVLSTHASKWNMGLSSASLGNSPVAVNDGPYQVDYQTPLVIPPSGVLGNDYARNGLTAILSEGSASRRDRVALVERRVPVHAGRRRLRSGLVQVPRERRQHRQQRSDGVSRRRLRAACRCRQRDVLEDSGTNTITVLSNDTDPDPGQVLHVTSVGSAAHGATSVAIGGNALTYAPAATYFGSDSFQYTISDGRGGTSTATVTVTVTSVNDAPTFVKGADQNVPMNAPAQSVANWATAMSAGPANEAGQTLAFSVTGNTNPTLFSVAPAVDATGRLTYTPAAGQNGLATITLQLKDNGGVADGGHDTSAAVTFTINVIYINSAPSFVKGPDQVLLGNPGARTVSPWATSISAGPAGDAGQTLAFTVTNNNAALFTAAPAVSPTGVLTYTIAPNAVGSAIVTVVLKDNGGTANGGADTSAPQTFNMSVNKASTATVLTSGNLTSLFGVEITLTATVADVAPGLGVPAGTITFKDGTTTLGTAVALVNGVATMKSSSLAVATHSLSAVYTPTGNFLGSTSAAISQVIKPSSTLKVNFSVHSMLDNTPKPKVQDLPVSGATVKVYTRLDQCANGLFVLNVPFLWGRIYDGWDGVGGTDPGCAPVSVGSYQAVATTDALGNATIIVPPTSSSPNTDYLIVGRTDKFDYIKTASSTDPLYSEYTLGNINASQSKNVSLHQLATFNGKILPAKQTEYFGSYLDVVEPEYVDWTDETEQYPFVMIAQGTWDVTTGVIPPDGFVPDVPVLAATAADTTTAIQFTLTDVGSDWTQTTVNQSIVHLGATTNTTTTIPMNNRRRSKARNDNVQMMATNRSVNIAVLANDYIGVKATTLALTSFTQPLSGIVTQLAGGTLVYTPNAGFTGLDTFTYTLTDDTGFQSTGTVSVKVFPTPTVRATSVAVPEGDTGVSAAIVSIVLANPSTVPVSVSYATADGTAKAGADYTAKSGTVTFNRVTRVSMWRSR